MIDGVCMQCHMVECVRRSEFYRQGELIWHLCCCDNMVDCLIFFFFSSRRRHTRSDRDWSSDVCSSDLLWEIATAFAGWRIGINPFDQPNVQESKDATKELLDYYKQNGKLQEQTALNNDGDRKSVV